MGNVRLGALALALSVLAVMAAPASALAAGSISGLVTDGSDPIAGVEVCASESPAEEEGEGFGCAETDSLGEYTITGLVSDTYKVEFWTPAPLNYVPQYFDGKSTWATADLVTVANGNDTPNIDAVLEEGGWIEGHVVDASEAAIEGLIVCALPIDETGFGRCALTDSLGDYELPGLATDSYEVAFIGEETDYLTQFYKGKEHFFEATPVSVTASMGTSGIDAKMKKGGQITGTVTDASSGAGIRFTLVCVLDAFEGEIFECVFTGGSGQYAIGGLPTGIYKVWFSPDGTESPEIDDGYFQQFYNDRPTFAQADSVGVVAGGAASGIDAHLVSRKAAPVKPLAAAPVIPVVKRRVPSVRCHRGQRKVKRKGKFHCVKIHRHKRHRTHRHHRRGRLYRPAAHRSMLP